MKSFLATTAIVLVMGGSAFAQSAPAAAPATPAAPVMSYQAQPTDIRASDFIGQRIYATKVAMDNDATVKSDATKDWDDIGEINEVIMDRQGDVKAVVLGVGGFLGIGEKSVALPMQDVKFVRNSDAQNDYFLVVNTDKEALNAAPSYEPKEQTASAADTVSPSDQTAANSGAMAPAGTAPMANGQAQNTAPATQPAAQPMDQAQTTPPAQTDTTTTASTTKGGAVNSAMEDSRTRLTPPSVTRDGYQAAEKTDLTADKLQGATVYGPKDENVASVDRLILNDNGQVKLVVLNVGGFLGMGAHEIAVTPDELNILRNTKGDDVRVYIDANKDSLKAQPEYKDKG